MVPRPLYYLDNSAFVGSNVWPSSTTEISDTERKRNIRRNFERAVADFPHKFMAFFFLEGNTCGIQSRVMTSHVCVSGGSRRRHLSSSGMKARHFNRFFSDPQQSDTRMICSSIIGDRIGDGILFLRENFHHPIVALVANNYVSFSLRTKQMSCCLGQEKSVV